MRDHAHCHHHAPAHYDHAFAVGVVLNLSFVVAEIGFGVSSRSLALLADAGHNVGDVLGLLMGWAAVVLATRPATNKHTYGYRRGSILAAVANSFLLMAGVGAVAWEAIQRLSAPVPIAGNVVMVVAAIGILVNGGTALMFARGRENDLNRQAAYTHMLVDAVVAAGVVVAGLIMRATHWSWVDPVCGLVVSALVAISSWSMLKRSLDLAMDAVPDGVDAGAARAYLGEVSGVTGVVDFHVWGVSTTETALTAHLVAPDGLSDEKMAEVRHELMHTYGISHSTIQVDRIALADGCDLNEGV